MDLEADKLITHFELIAMLGVLMAAFILPVSVYQNRFTRFVVQKFHRIAIHRGLSVLLIGVVSLSMHVPSLLRQEYVAPTVHDEFSYLLAAETFASGRLTNEPHEMWEHFESFHIIQQPTYMSKYPPGQAIFLALGIRVGGHPIFGVWISMALACSAICWMLQAWLPERWALFGALLATLRLTAGPWGNSYWGGAVAALGGALLFGAMRRMLQENRWQDGLMLGLGLVVLMFSRPYEGLVITVPVLIFMGVSWFKSDHISFRDCVKPAVSCLTMLIVGIGWSGYYNWKVTGDAFMLPYQVHDTIYAANPTFFWQSELNETPEYRHREFEEYFVEWELPRFQRKSVLWGFNSSLGTKLWTFFRFFIGPAFVLPLIVLWRNSKDQWIRFATIGLFLVVIAFSQTLYFHPHYAAPVISLMFVLAIAGIRFVRLWTWQGRPIGRLLVTGTMVVFLFAPLFSVWDKEFLRTARTRVIEKLVQKKGKHLVVVRYAPNHSCHKEWVYNGAELDSAKIVWAREMGPEKDAELLDYFRDRKIWLMEIDDRSRKLKRYPGLSVAASTSESASE